MFGLASLCFLLMQTGALGFGIGFFGGNSLSHQDITERAILNSTVQVCRALAVAEGKDFTFPSQPFTAESVAVACEASKSSKSFCESIKLIKKKNWWVDIRHVFNSNYHFDAEKFSEGRKLITDGLSALKAAREKLGEIFPTL